VSHIESAWISNKNSFIIMKYEKGMTLDEFIKKQGGRISEPLASKIKGDLFTGMTQLHKAGVVHADIKPSNIYVVFNEKNEYEKIIYIDFGLSLPIGTETGYRGTPAFLEPSLKCLYNLSVKGVKGIDGVKHKYTQATNQYALRHVFDALDGNKDFQMGGVRRRRSRKNRSRRSRSRA
jgi:serine/threonine protein kinase